jgi:hypothetical protein
MGSMIMSTPDEPPGFSNCCPPPKKKNPGEYIGHEKCGCQMTKNQSDINNILLYSSVGFSFITRMLGLYQALSLQETQIKIGEKNTPRTPILMTLKKNRRNDKHVPEFQTLFAQICHQPSGRNNNAVHARS